MFVGRVIANVVSTVKWPQLSGLKLLVVQPFELKDLQGLTDRVPGPDSERPHGVVVADTLDAGIGDTVVVAFGHAARVAIAPEIGQGSAPPHPIDAAVVAIVDEIDVS